MAAAGAVRHHDGVGLLTHGRQQAQLGHLHGVRRSRAASYPKLPGQQLDSISAGWAPGSAITSRMGN
jgi:hypothetical protein